MLFNSFGFIFLFLPFAVTVFFWLGERSSSGVSKTALSWLVLASLVFYAWWNPSNLWVLLLSISFNYAAGLVLKGRWLSGINRRLVLAVAIALNLAFIGYFKYANFFFGTLNTLFQTQVGIESIVLPLAISFFTFVQITYLVDAYKGQTQDDTFLNYCLFVTFFPHLIAGPIVHHKDLIPQFGDRSIYRFNERFLAIGLTIFFIGLFKKVVFADSIATYATQTFTAVDQGATLTFFESWVGALTYTLQLYFDFSGYSDMAIGASYLFGIKLPLNFNSPYKAVDIIEFWRRWHITLSNFLRDYLYIPLGGSRKGKVRRHLNLMITMLLGGLWHGAGWTFVLWGGIHGIYLIVNHQWRTLRKSLGHDANGDSWVVQVLSCLVTFLAVAVSWVFFRAKDLAGATSMLSSMAGLNGISLPRGLFKYFPFLEGWGIQFNGLTNNMDLPEGAVIALIVALLAVVWFTPNTQQWMGAFNPLDISFLEEKSSHPMMGFWKRLQWRPNALWAIAGAGISAISLLNLTRISEFLYFQF